MYLRKFCAALWPLSLILLAYAMSLSPAAATVVRFETVLGSVNVRLYDARTPLSAANFLNYAEDGDYVDSFIHRSVPGFVVQGGGFTFVSNQTGVASVPTDPPVQNEPGISNLRGTIAMAKLGGDPNSATSQWFFNLANNSANLDAQNGGFTVFGRVLGNGMTVVDAIAALPRVNAGSPFDTLPVRNYSGGTIVKDNLVIVSAVTVLNNPPGDYNLDGVVNTADLSVWQADYGSITKAEADGNGNGMVDGRDFLIWQRSFGQTTPPPVIVAVPEPGAIGLLTIALLGLAARRPQP